MTTTQDLRHYLFHKESIIRYYPYVIKRLTCLENIKFRSICIQLSFNLLVTVWRCVKAWAVVHQLVIILHSINYTSKVIYIPQVTTIAVL